MKHLIVAFVFSISFNSWSQQVYGSISAAYQVILDNKKAPNFLTNSYHQLSQPWFWEKEHVFFKEATSLDLSFGHQINKNLAYELGVSYLKPFDTKIQDAEVYRTLSGDLFRINPKFKININLNKTQLYAKLGFTIAGGKLNYHQYFKTDNSTTLGFEEAILDYKYSGGISFGLNGFLGISRNITNKIAIFAEISGVYHTHKPKKGSTIKYEVDGEDKLTKLNLRKYSTDIQFGDAEETSMSTSDMNRAQKLYNYSFSLTGFGFNLGFKFILWEKEKNK